MSWGDARHLVPSTPRLRLPELHDIVSLPSLRDVVPVFEFPDNLFASPPEVPLPLRLPLPPDPPIFPTPLDDAIERIRRLLGDRRPAPPSFENPLEAVWDAIGALAEDIDSAFDDLCVPQIYEACRVELWQPLDQAIPSSGLDVHTPIGVLHVMAADTLAQPSGNSVTIDEYHALAQEASSPLPRWGLWRATTYSANPFDSGPESSLANYKDDWVRSNKTTLRVLSRMHEMPPQLLAGVAWVEAGGSPPSEDWVAFHGRRARIFDGSADRTTFGEIQISLRNAGKILALNPETQACAIVNLLNNYQRNLAVVAEHIDHLIVKKYGHVAADEFTDEMISFGGAAYNGSGEAATNYGKFISSPDRQARLLNLLGLVQSEQKN